MARPAYDAEQIRRAEQPLLASLPDGTLMQRAANALAARCAVLLPRVYGANVVLLVGAGNNGGDALFAGARLAARGARVHAVQAADRIHGGGVAALLANRGRLVPLAAAEALIADAALVIDGMLGIGGSGGLRGEQARLAGLLDNAPAVVVAVDVPSGVDASTGAIDGAAVVADVTVTFGAMKIGLAVVPGFHHAGLVEVVDIGLDLPSPEVTLIDADDVAATIPSPTGETDKYRRGVLGVVAGSDAYTGAPVMVVGGALASAGMVRYVGTSAVADVVRRRWPETVVTVIEPGDADAVLDAGQVQAWAVGPGLGTDEDATAIVKALLQTDVPVVLDADAVTIVAKDPSMLRQRTAPTLLTPHAGEFARLAGVDRDEVEARRLEALRPKASELGVSILLKGSTTLVADPDGSVRINTADTPYLATAGSGDVLTGICGALLAGGVDATDAGAAGAFVHGLAGIIAAGEPQAPVHAMQIAAAVPEALRRIGG